MYASAQASDAKVRRQKRSRLIKEMAADLNRNEDSIASSTGSAHGTVSTDPTFTESIRQEESMHEIHMSPSITPPPFEYLDDSDSFGFHPGRDGAINSTGQLDISYTDMKRIAREQYLRGKSQNGKAKLPELRTTAKKYGRWSPKPAQLSYVIDVSAIDRAFPDFSGGIDSDDDISRDLGRPANPRRAKHISIDVPVYCDTTGHSDSARVSHSDTEVTSTSDQVHVDILKSLPLQDLSLTDLNQRPHYAESSFSVEPSTKSTNIKATTTVLTNHKHSKSVDTIEVERIQSPFKHFNRNHVPSVAGNKENIVPKSNTLPKANAGSPMRPVNRSSSNPRFQARVRDELDSSRITSVSREGATGTQDIHYDISITSTHPIEASFISLRSAANSQQQQLPPSIRLERHQREASSSIATNNKRKQSSTIDRATSRATEASVGSNGTVVHSTESRLRDNWHPQGKLPTGLAHEDQSVPAYAQKVNAKKMRHTTPNPTVMSFVAPFKSTSAQYATHISDLGLPSIKNGQIQRSNRSANPNASFGVIDGFELPEDEEDIYQMCESQKVRIALLEEEREMQTERIRILEQEMAEMKRQVAEVEVASNEKWQTHKCSDPKLQDQFNNLQAAFAQVKHESSIVAKENLEMRLAKHEYESHKCVDTKLEMENAQLRADNAQLEERLRKLEAHRCADSGLENENQQLKTNLEKYQSHVCRDKRLEREVRYLKEMKGNSDVHLHITLKDSRCRKRKESS